MSDVGSLALQPPSITIGPHRFSRIIFTNIFNRVCDLIARELVWSGEAFFPQQYSIVNISTIALIQTFDKHLLKHYTVTMRDLDIHNLPDLLTLREVADILRVSPLTIKRWGERGKLPAIRINSRGDRRYKKSDILYLLNIKE